VPARDRGGVRSPRAPPARARFDLTLRVESKEEGTTPALLGDVAAVDGAARLQTVGHSPFLAAGANLVSLADVLGTFAIGLLWGLAAEAA